MKYKIYCINIYERENEYNKMKKQFKKYNLNVHFIRNYKHKFGGLYGCFDSHIQAVKDAYANNLDCCLVFEDDIILNNNCVKIINECLTFMNNHKDIDILYSHNNGCIYLTELISKNFYKGVAYGALSIFINKKFIKKIILNYKTYLEKFVHYDHFLIEISNHTIIHTNYLVELNVAKSQNNKLKNLQEFTTLHIELTNLGIIKFFKFLIKTNNIFILNKIVEYLNKIQNIIPYNKNTRKIN